MGAGTGTGEAPAAGVEVRDMRRWLGDGGMPILTEVGVAIEAYGTGWAEGTWVPTALACNPAGYVNTGVQSVVLDAFCSFALNAALARGTRIATLELKVSTIRATRAGADLRARGEVVRLASRLAFVRGRVVDDLDQLVCEATGTFNVRRPAPAGDGEP